MTHIDLLLPFAMPPAELARDLFAALPAPALSTLLGRADAGPATRSDDFARALPHERWLCRQAALPDSEANSPPVAASLMRRLGLESGPGCWFVLQPVHIHIARDHLVLTDPRQLALSEPDARALFAAAAPLFEEAGYTLRWGDAARWFLRADAWAGMVTATPDAACGRNIDVWMPSGEHARAWRKLQNEVQMHWHDGPVNTAREAAGLNSVNSLWLWGAAPSGRFAASPWQAGAGAPDWALAADTGVAGDPDSLLSRAAPRALVVAESLAEAALGGDWGEWLARLAKVEADWCAPLLAALQDGRISRLAIVLSDQSRLAEYRLTAFTLKKFWRRPSLHRLSA